MNPAPLPLIVAVTGHRDPRPEDVPALQAKAKAFFQHLRDTYRNTPLLLLSALAEGADRLVARTAIEAGVRLVVPLPLPPEVYEEDFATDESKAEFRNLLEKADAAFNVSKGRIPFVPGTDQATRINCYALVGVFMVRNCQILLALWDGVDSYKEGGTSEIVRFKREGIPEGYEDALAGTSGAASAARAIEPEETGPVYHIRTPRISNPEPTGMIGKPYTVLYPRRFSSDIQAADAFDRIFRRIDTFNSDVKRLINHRKMKSRTPRERLLPEVESDRRFEDLRTIGDHYTNAADLANSYQGWTYRTLVSLFGLGFAAATTFDLYAHLQPLQHWLSAFVFFSLLGSAYALYLWAKRNDVQNRYLDYRALAEGLRVRFFWRLVGLDGDVEDYYLGKQRSELEWIRHALRTWRLLEGRAGPGCVGGLTVGLVDRLSWALKHWVEGQRDYFEKTVQRDQRRVKRSEWAVQGLIVLGLLLVLASLRVLHKLGPCGHGLLLVSAGLCPVAAALIHGHTEKRALPEHIKQYARMGDLFRNVLPRLEQRLDDNDLDGTLQLLRELGKEALAEHGDWVLLHHERPLEVPHR